MINIFDGKIAERRSFEVLSDVQAVGGVRVVGGTQKRKGLKARCVRSSLLEYKYLERFFSFHFLLLVIEESLRTNFEDGGCSSDIYFLSHAYLSYQDTSLNKLHIPLSFSPVTTKFNLVSIIDIKEPFLKRWH